jgi:hypothetical protein
MSPTPREEVIADVTDEQVRLGILYWSAKNEIVEFYLTYTDDEEILERAEEGDYEPLAHRLMRAGDPFNEYGPPHRYDTPSRQATFGYGKAPNPAPSCGVEYASTYATDSRKC